MNRHIYCISGLGADERIFSKLDVPGVTFRHLSWIQPLPKESFQSYARRMYEQIKGEELPVLLGVSFGGIMAVEMAKTFPVKQVFLISSVKLRTEMPFWMKASGRLRLHKILQLRPHRIFYPIEDYFLGVKTKEDKQMAAEYRSKVDANYLQWAIDGILNWKNKATPSNVVHIHGTKDHLFPYKKIREAYPIQNGGHFMIYNNVNEINSLITRLLV